MSATRNELHRLIRDNEHEQWVPNDEALQRLEYLDDDLIPGLIECLNDKDPKVRCLAVELLIEARPRSNIAVPELIKRLADEDRNVQSAVVNRIADFGPLAVEAIPFLEPWLDFSHEYLRVLAMTTIVILDPSRTELLPEIKATLASDNPNVRFVAREFFAKTKTALPFDGFALMQTVWHHWHYHSPCEQFFWQSEQADDGTWRNDAAPVYQEIFGGEKDGMQIWAGFEFDVVGLFIEPGFSIKDYGTLSKCPDHNPTPLIGIKGEYFGEPFVLRIHLEPIPDSPVREIVDVLRNEVREINVTDESDTP